jgi:hypothetical protein
MDAFYMHHRPTTVSAHKICIREPGSDTNCNSCWACYTSISIHQPSPTRDQPDLQQALVPLPPKRLA